MASEASNSSSYYINPSTNNNNNNNKHSNKRFAKMNPNDKDIDMDDRQQLGSAGGYVDDLMERIRKMPPKKRSKFFHMLDEERLKDLNNNNQASPRKSKISDGEDDENEHHIHMDVSMPLAVADVHSEEEDERTVMELKQNSKKVHLNDDDSEEIKSKLRQQQQQQQQSLFGLNDKSFEELRSMGIPIAVLRAIAYQQHQQAQPLNTSNNQMSNFLASKRTVPSSTNPSSDTKSLLNARTILRRILQEHQKEQQGETLIESMNYTIDEEGAILDDDDDDIHQSSSITPHNRNGVRSNSHNPGPATLNPNDISSLSPPTSTSSSPDETDVNHQTSPASLSRPSSTPAALIFSGY